MRIGAVYPQYELGGDPAAVAAFGVGAEESGFAHLLCFDHVVGSPQGPPRPGPYTHEHSFHDPFVLFAYLSGLTTRIEFATGVLVLPQRQTVLVARQAADVELLSGGRLRLGVSIGWNEVEYDALGQDFATRGSRLSEQIELLRLLWTGELVSFRGRFDRIDGANINPPPSAPIPVWLGGSNARAFARAAALGDGFVFGGRRAAETAPLLDALREALREAGRDVAGFGTEFVSRGPDARSIVEDIARWHDLGGSHAAVGTMMLGLPNRVEEHLALLAEVKEGLVARGLW